jgi:hypothetical protein
LVVSIESPAEEAFAFWERFKAAFDQSADEHFADDFRPFNALNWSVKFADRDSAHLREHTSDVGRHALSRSAVDSVREAALELPFMVWLKEHRWFLADLLRNSVGNVEEEAVAPLDVSYRVVERSWWKRSSESSGLSYGLRPFRTNPYAFLSMGFMDGDTLLLSGLVRYYFHNFADHRFELALAVPLAHGFSMDVGTSYEFGQHDDQKGLVLKLLKGFKGGGILHVGFEVKQRSVLLAGIAIPW